MASTPIPSAYPSLMLQAQRAFQGATTIGPAIPLLINTAALIGADRENLNTAQVLFQTSSGAMTALNEAMDTARSNAFDYCVHSRDVLKFYFGRTYNQAWRAAGFINKTAVPAGEAGLHNLLQALQAYFTANPTHQNPDLEVTAAEAGTLLAAMNTARAAIDTQKNLIDAKHDDRNEKKEAVTSRLSGLRKELSLRLDPLDPRWREFGFNLPGAASVPSAPKNVVALAGVPGQLQVTCDSSPTTTTYRFYYQRPIIDPEPIHAGNATEPLFIISGLASGQSYLVYASAGNAGGESELSQPASATVNVAAAA